MWLMPWGKEVVNVTVLRENRHASVWILGGIAANQTRLRLNRLILYVCEAFPESNCAGLIREWTRKIRISARGRNDVAVSVIGLAF